MTTPFGSKTPIVLDMIKTTKGNTTPGVAVGLIISVTTTSNLNEITVAYPWYSFSGITKWAVVWGHGDTSTVAGNVVLDLYDFTNNSILITASSNGTTANNGNASSYLATTLIFTKPNTDSVKIGLRARLITISTAINFNLWQSDIVLIP